MSLWLFERPPVTISIKAWVNSDCSFAYLSLSPASFANCISCSIDRNFSSDFFSIKLFNKGSYFSLDVNYSFKEDYLFTYYFDSGIYFLKAFRGKVWYTLNSLLENDYSVLPLRKLRIRLSMSVMFGSISLSRGVSLTVIICDQESDVKNMVYWSINLPSL